MTIIREIQLGKNGITDAFIDSLKNQFVRVQNVKISVLKSFCRDKKELEKIKEEILEKLGKNYTARSIGYTLAVKKWRKAREDKE
jgi:RNA-binding protein YhbY